MPRNTVITLRLDDEEAARLRELAGKYNLPRAELVRRMIRGRAIPDPSNHQAVKALADMNKRLKDLANDWRRLLAGTDLRIEGLRPLVADAADTMAMIKALSSDLSGSAPRASRVSGRDLDRLLAPRTPGRAGRR